MPVGTPTGLTDDFAEQWGGRWKAFIKRERMGAAPEELGVLIHDLRGFLVPLMTASADASHWPPGGPWLIDERQG